MRNEIANKSTDNKFRKQKVNYTPSNMMIESKTLDILSQKKTWDIHLGSTHVSALKDQSKVRHEAEAYLDQITRCKY
jgi:hypothetical protein